MQTPKKQIFPSRSKDTFFALPDGGHLWPDGSHLGFMGQNDVITSYWCQNRNLRGRCTRKSVFIHAFRCSGSKVMFSFYMMAAILDLWVKIMSLHQTNVRIRILVDDLPENVSSYTWLLALWFKSLFLEMVPAAILDLALNRQTLAARE